MKKRKNKRILILSAAYLPYVGGAEIAVREITNRLPNWQFDLITARLSRRVAKREKIGNVDVYRMGIGHPFLDKYWFLFFGFFKTAYLHLKNKYVVVWSIMLSYNGFVWLFKLVFRKVKFLLTLQEGDPVEYILSLKRVRLLRPFFQLVFKQADYVQVISYYLYNWARQMGVKCLLEIVPNGVDLSIFRRADNEEMKRLKEELVIQKNEKIIITVSRLVKKNGIGDLIKAGRYLKFPFKMLIIGSGPLENSLKQLADNLELDESVLFLGQIKHNELYKYYSISDVFVRPSLSEGFGNVFVEAVACGVPIIGTGNVGGSAVNLIQGYNCQPNNPVSLANVIRKVLFEEDIEKRIETGQLIIKKEYTWEGIALRMEEIFKKLS